MSCGRRIKRQRRAEIVPGVVISIMLGVQVACESGGAGALPQGHQTPVASRASCAPDVLHAPLADSALRAACHPVVRALGANSMEATELREGLDEHGIQEQPACANGVRSVRQVIEIGDESDDDGSKQEDCSICRQAILDQWKCETPCGHRYHYTCIAKWVRLNTGAARCPMCRHAAQPLVHVICDL